MFLVGCVTATKKSSVKSKQSMQSQLESPSRAMLGNETQWPTLTSHVYWSPSWLQPRCPKNRSAANAEAGPPAAVMLLEQINRAAFRSEAMPSNAEVRTETTIQLWFKYFAPTLKGLEFDKLSWCHDPLDCILWVWIDLEKPGFQRTPDVSHRSHTKTCCLRVDPFTAWCHLGSWHFDLRASSWHKGMPKPITYMTSHGYLHADFQILLISANWNICLDYLAVYEYLENQMDMFLTKSQQFFFIARFPR